MIFCSMVVNFCNFQICWCGSQQWNFKINSRWLCWWIQKGDVLDIFKSRSQISINEMQTKKHTCDRNNVVSSPTMDGKSTLVFETTNYVMKYLPRIQGLPMCNFHLQLWEAMEPSLDALHWYNSGRIPNDIFTTISRIEVNRIISLRLKSSASLTGKNSDRKMVWFRQEKHKLSGQKDTLHQWKLT